MNYANWIPLVAGMALILGLMAYIFRTRDIPNILALLVMVGALFCALPYLQNFVLKGASFEWSANLRDNLAGDSATLQGEMTQIREALNALLKKSGEPPIVVPALRESIVVFYGQGRNQLADQIRSWLLNQGYNSSATATDFTELGKDVLPTGNVKLRYMPNFAAKLPDFAKSLDQQFHLGTIQTESASSSVATQLLLF
jgi:hypothetical protein